MLKLLIPRWWLIFAVNITFLLDTLLLIIHKEMALPNHQIKALWGSSRSCCRKIRKLGIEIEIFFVDWPDLYKEIHCNITLWVSIRCWSHISNIPWSACDEVDSTIRGGTKCCTKKNQLADNLAGEKKWGVWQSSTKLEQDQESIRQKDQRSYISDSW